MGSFILSNSNPFKHCAFNSSEAQLCGLTFQLRETRKSRLGMRKILIGNIECTVFVHRKRKIGHVVKAVDWLRRPGINSQTCHWLPLWHWANCLFVSQFSTCSMGICLFPLMLGLLTLWALQGQVSFTICIYIMKHPGSFILFGASQWYYSTNNTTFRPLLKATKVLLKKASTSDTDGINCKQVSWHRSILSWNSDLGKQYCVLQVLHLIGKKMDPKRFEI